jgi:hypothetical protein
VPKWGFKFIFCVKNLHETNFMSSYFACHSIECEFYFLAWTHVFMGRKQQKNEGLHYFSMWCWVKGIFTIRVPLFGHKTQGLCFCYLPNIKSKWNKFKQEILDNSNYHSFHGGGDFSHAYVIMHKYFGKKPEL